MADKKQNRLTSYAEEKARSIFDLNTMMEFIQKDFPLRTSSEEFRKAVEEKALEIGISEKELIKYLKRKDKLGPQNFSNWWNGFNKDGKPIDIRRDSAIKIAFHLKMNVEEAQEFLTRSCWHDSFYMRDYRDLIYMFFLENMLEYDDAVTMIKDYKHLDNQNPLKEERALNGRRITDHLKSQYEENVSTLEDFKGFLESNAPYFGSFRRKAYEKFMKMYHLVKNEDDVDRPTDGEICQMILMSIPSLRGSNKITNEILIKIAENTIQRSGLSEIVNKIPDKRTGKIEQIDRKHLILIWVLSYGGRPGFTDASETQKEFEECIDIINCELLKECGMPIIDLRNPFDWLIFNALYYSYFANDDDDTDAVERINAVMDTLFRERSDED